MPKVKGPGVGGSSGYPPIAPELLALCKPDGSFHRGGFVPGQPDQEWEAYKAGKMKYCNENGLKLVEFKKAAAQQLGGAR
jgi:hypothetical protein